MFQCGRDPETMDRETLRFFWLADRFSTGHLNVSGVKLAYRTWSAASCNAFVSSATTFPTANIRRAPRTQTEAIFVTMSGHLLSYDIPHRLPFDGVFPDRRREAGMPPGDWPGPAFRCEKKPNLTKRRARVGAAAHSRHKHRKLGRAEMRALALETLAHACLSL